MKMAHVESAAKFIVKVYAALMTALVALVGVLVLLWLTKIMLQAISR